MKNAYLGLKISMNNHISVTVLNSTAGEMIVISLESKS